jgi:hypothetical protein
VSKRLPPSAALEAAIDELVSQGLGDAERLADIGRLGARLVLQRALEEEVAEFLGRARLVIAAGRGLALTDFEQQQLAQMRASRRAQSEVEMTA